MSHSARSRVILPLFAALAISAVSVSAAPQLGAVKDGWLVMKVHSEMVDEEVLSGSNIDVDVKNGVVTLKGTVPSEAGRARALEVARKNDGVKNVVDLLRIAPARGSNIAGKVDKAEDRAQSGAAKAADKTAGAANKTGRSIDDGWIKSKIYAQYLADWNTILDDSDIDIDVADNVVTLSGTVKSAQAKTKAVSVAKATDGVKSVRDKLRIAGS
jgi:hyperosmotically inducible protein